jgi:hypothetical protein
MKHFYPIILLLNLLWMAESQAQQTNTAGTDGSANATATDGSVHTSLHDQMTTANASPTVQVDGKPVASPAAPPDPLLDVPPLPTGKVSLIGGTVKNLDRVRNRFVVQAFGGQQVRISFDERTHIYRDGVETTQLGLRKGDRVYVDTMLDGTRVFARNVRVQTGARAADSAGQVVSVNARKGSITLWDRLAAQPVTFQVDQKTSFTLDQRPASFKDLKPGAIVAVKFAPERPNRGLAREIAIFAAPGMQFTFVGKVTNLDLRLGTLSLENQTDGKTYDLSFSPARVDKMELLGVGSQVTVIATFEASGYRADTVTVIAAPEAAKRNQR